MDHECHIPPLLNDDNRAARCIMTDDSMNIGIHYRGNRKPLAAKVTNTEVTSKF